MVAMAVSEGASSDAAEAEVADDAAVEAAPGRLELLDDLHGAHLRGAGQGAGRERRGERVVRGELRPQLTDHSGHDVHHVAVALHRGELRHLDGARYADPAEVVAGQVDEHDVFGPLLRVGHQVGRERGVLVGGGAAPAGAGDGVQQRPAAGHLEVRLGRRADDVEAVEPKQVHVWRGVRRPQHPVDVQRVGLGGALEPLRHNDLEALAVADRLLRRLHRLGV